MISEVKAVVFDWAGTMVDFGSFAPMKSFVAAFEAFGVDVTLEAVSYTHLTLPTKA